MVFNSVEELQDEISRRLDERLRKILGVEVTSETRFRIDQEVRVAVHEVYSEVMEGAVFKFKPSKTGLSERQRLLKDVIFPPRWRRS